MALIGGSCVISVSDAARFLFSCFAQNSTYGSADSESDAINE